MSAYAELLKWSLERPAWQRDALRLLVMHGHVDDHNLARHALVCMAEHGLVAPGELTVARPLGPEHIPQQPPNGAAVHLRVLKHVGGVNALAKGQSVAFQSAGLSVIYGDNGAGKSGYARILKRLCRARLAESRLEPNVFAESRTEPSATVDFTVGAEAMSFTWTGEMTSDDAPRELAAISVFDALSAEAYLSVQQKAAYAPAGLDVLEKLAKVCDRLKTLLEADRSRTAGTRLPPVGVDPSTDVGRMLAALGPETREEDVGSLAAFTEADQVKLAEARVRARERAARDPERTAKELRFRARRVSALSTRLRAATGALADDALEATWNAKVKALATAEAARAAAGRAFDSQSLPGIGDSAWRELWAAARRYSEEHAYQGSSFPQTETGSRCVLCQQPLDDAARRRLCTFDEFVRTEMQAAAKHASIAFDAAKVALTGVALDVDTDGAVLDELQLEAPSLAESTRLYFAALRVRRAAAAAACSLEGGWPTFDPLPVDVTPSLDSLTTANEDAALAVLAAKAGADDGLAKVVRELEGRQWLHENQSAVFAELERLRREAKYDRCVDSTQTRGITTKTADLTRRLVSDALQRAFAEELRLLDVAKVGVHIDVTDARRGAVFHSLTLHGRGDTQVQPKRILSEGECRCVALAAFFAELRTSGHASGIALDDPVSSLDHMRRGRVADRLVAEAKRRQVVVFTHDLAFVLQLREQCQRVAVSFETQHVRVLRDGPGVCQPGLPWGAMDVNERLSRLNVALDQGACFHRDGDVDAYEQRVALIYGRLREAWERGVEEVLLNRAVQRFERGISTKPLAKVEILASDLEQLEAAMTKSSRWLAGHDDAPALNEPVPPPTEVRADIAALAAWVSAIRKRRDKK